MRRHKQVDTEAASILIILLVSFVPVDTVYKAREVSVTRRPWIETSARSLNSVRLLYWSEQRRRSLKKAVLNDFGKFT